ncbi:MAG: helix-turn-helix domain-containing protein [Lachnospiraceae bacterium]|nr:helix-turn-helix domain-containing protein [Lachnospiraceae bacterium]
MTAIACKSITVDTLLDALKGSPLPELIYRKYLEPIAEYDKFCGTDYMDFVADYIKYDGHIKTISEKSYVHRNTVHYRIRKIEEILGCDISRLDTKMNIMIAYAYYEHMTA